MFEQFRAAAADKKTRAWLTAFNGASRVTWIHDLEFSRINQDGDESMKTFTFRQDGEGLIGPGPNYFVELGNNLLFEMEDHDGTIYHYSYNASMMKEVLMMAIELFPGRIGTLKLHKDCASFLNDYFFHPNMRRNCELMEIEDPSDERQVKNLTSFFRYEPDPRNFPPTVNPLPQTRGLVAFRDQIALNPGYPVALLQGINDGLSHFLETRTLTEQFALASCFPRAKDAIAQFNLAQRKHLAHRIIFNVVSGAHQGITENKLLTFVVKDLENPQDSITWKFYQNDMIMSESWCLGDQELRGVHRNGNVFRHGDYNVSMIRDVLKFCADIFPGRIQKLVLYNDSCKWLKSYFCHPNVARECEHMEIVNPTDRRTAEWVMDVFDPDIFKLKSEYNRINVVDMLHTRSCEINGTDWISGWYLLRCRSEKLFLVGDQFENEDLKTFITRWKDEKNTELKWVGVCTDRIDAEEISKDLEFEEQDCEREYLLGEEVEAAGVDRISFERSWDFTRDDGVHASIVEDFNCFWFLVWPDLTNEENGEALVREVALVAQNEDEMGSDEEENECETESEN
ncbi:unnamed protein product [Caenorhabditis sp. 36 PRJEB53466]|nr:unnamed protein product [Caenorhabditis sp. 36 PRJEB53466]